MTKFTAKTHKVNTKYGIKTCNICLEEITKNIKKTSCKHYFHPKCLRKWIKNSPTCPMCRTHVHIPKLSTESPLPIPVQRNLTFSDEITLADVVSFIDELSNQLFRTPNELVQPINLEEAHAQLLDIIQNQDQHESS
jgi:hypothetical protein